MVWLQGRHEGSEEAAATWDRLVAWVQDPPVVATAYGAPETPGRVRVSHPEVLPAGAPLDADAQAAAFAAYEGA